MCSFSLNEVLKMLDDEQSQCNETLFDSRNIINNEVTDAELSNDVLPTSNSLDLLNTLDD